jgi:hypothetical protein
MKRGGVKKKGCKGGVGEVIYRGERARRAVWRAKMRRE